MELYAATVRLFNKLISLIKNMNKKLAALVGKRIAKMRKAKGLTQDKLALFAEIDRSYVGRIERGEVNLTVEKLYEIAETLGCDAKELLP